MKAGVERKRNLKRRKWTEWRVMERKQILGTAQRAGVRVEDEGETKGGVEVETEDGAEGEAWRRKWGRRRWRSVADGRRTRGQGGGETMRAEGKQSGRDRNTLRYPCSLVR